MKPLIIVKIGGSLLAPKHATEPHLDGATLERLAREVGNGYKAIKKTHSLLVIHGAGSFGHIIVKQTGIDKGMKTEKDMLAFGETQRRMNAMNVDVVSALLRQQVPAFPLQASSAAIMNRGSLSTFPLHAIQEMINQGIVPVTYGVPAIDVAQGSSILSGDEIAPYLARRLHAEKIIHATDVDGVFTADPRNDHRATLVPVITNKTLKTVILTSSKNTDVTGGMWKKVTQLKKSHTLSHILNGSVAGNLEKAMLGHYIGTQVDFR